jgi:hypothetical protein
MDLTERILQGMKGRLGITVSHPDIAGRMEVSGISSNPAEFGWTNMPEAMRVADRVVYCCTSNWHADPVFIFEDEATVVDAPASMVVDAMLELIGDIRNERAMTKWDVINILEGGYEDDEVEEEGYGDGGLTWSQAKAQGR